MPTHSTKNIICCASLLLAYDDDDLYRNLKAEGGLLRAAQLGPSCTVTSSVGSRMGHTLRIEPCFSNPSQGAISEVICCAPRGAGRGSHV